MSDIPFSPSEPTGVQQLSEIAVIIVNYGTPNFTITAVESALARAHGGRQVEIHVVDNASPDDSQSLLRDAHAVGGWGDRVTLHLEETNHGFGRGCNVVIDQLLARRAPPAGVFLLNPDAQLENEAIDLMAQRMEANPKLGFAGAAISTPDGEPRVAAFRFPSVVSELTQTLAFGPVSRLLERWSVPLAPDTPEGPVHWVAGAAMLMRTETLRELGGFDPDFFLYYEEVELMRRGARAGWGCLYVPEARVIHVEGAATDVKSKRVERKRMPAYHYQSWRMYFTKTLGRFGALAAALAHLLGASLNQVHARLRGKEPSAAPHFFGDFWQHVLQPLIFRMR